MYVPDRCLHIVWIVNASTDDSSSQRMDGHIDGWTYWVPQIFTYSSLTYLYVEIIGEFSSVKVVSTRGPIKVDVTPNGTTIKDPSGSSCMCPTGGLHVVWIVDALTDDSSSQRMDGHTDDWIYWVPQIFTYSSLMYLYVEITCTPHPKTLLCVRIFLKWEEKP